MIAEVPRRGDICSNHDGDECTGRGTHEIGERLALPDTTLIILNDHGSHREDDARRDERGDERVCARLYERRNRGRDAFPLRGAREDRRGEKHERRAKAAERENRKTRLVTFAALLEDRGRDNRRDEEHEPRDDDCSRRTSAGLQDWHVLVDDVGLHILVRPLEAADLHYLVGKRDRHQVDEDVAEHADILHRYDERERHNGEKENLVVRKPQPEHERREPENEVRGLPHPAVAKEEDPHKEKRVERIDLDDSRLRPLDGGERERERTSDAAAETERLIDSLPGQGFGGAVSPSRQRARRGP